MTTPGDELFELCKELYKRTGWTLGFEGIMHDDYIPAYASDYLLEKLPKEFVEYDAYHEQDVCYILTLRAAGNEWLANYTYENVAMHHVFGDTPLKALLRLTLKLHEEGQL